MRSFFDPRKYLRTLTKEASFHKSPHASCRYCSMMGMSSDTCREPKPYLHLFPYRVTWQDSPYWKYVPVGPNVSPNSFCETKNHIWFPANLEGFVVLGISWVIHKCLLDSQLWHSFPNSPPHVWLQGCVQTYIWIPSDWLPPKCGNVASLLSLDILSRLLSMSVGSHSQTWQLWKLENLIHNQNKVWWVPL